MKYKLISLVTINNDLELDSHVIEIDTKYEFVARLYYRKMLKEMKKNKEIQKYHHPVAIEYNRYLEDIEVSRWWLE